MERAELFQNNIWNFTEKRNLEKILSDSSFKAFENWFSEIKGKWNGPSVAHIIATSNQEPETIKVLPKPYILTNAFLRRRYFLEKR